MSPKFQFYLIWSQSFSFNLPEPKVLVEHVRKGTQHPVQNNGLSMWTCRVTPCGVGFKPLASACEQLYFSPGRTEFKTMASSCEQVYFPLVGLGSKLCPQHMNKYISPWRGWVQNHGLSMWTYIPLVGLGSKLWPQHVNKYISPLVGLGSKLWPQHVNKYISPGGAGLMRVEGGGGVEGAPINLSLFVGNWWDMTVLATVIDK